MAEVRVEALCKRYRTVEAVRDLTFTTYEGEFFTLFGPSGAGKTTTLKLIAGIERPNAGEVFIGNQRVTEWHPADRDVSMTFENYNLYPHFTVYENIAFPLRAPRRARAFSREEERERVSEIAQALGMIELLDRRPAQLSGGQKQRVSLARSLVRRPAAYLLDEPIAHLDAKLRNAMRAHLKRLTRKMGITTIYVTHDYKEALGMSDRIAVMREGRLEQLGTPDELYEQPASDFVANLIGDPPVNFIDGQIDVEEEKWLFRGAGGISLPVPREIASRAQDVAEHGKVRLGVRAPYVEVCSEGSERSSFSAKVFAVERKQELFLLTLDYEEGMLQALHPQRLEVGAVVGVDIDIEHVHFFRPTVVFEE